MQYEEPAAVEVEPAQQTVEVERNDVNPEPISFDRPAQAPVGSHI